MKEFIDHMSSRLSPCRAPAVQDILSFLQSGLDITLSVSSLQVQVSVFLLSLECHGQAYPCSPILHEGSQTPKEAEIPQVGPPSLLDFFAQRRSEPGKSLSFKELVLKTTFLVAITSAKRTSEIQALGSKDPFLTFFTGRVVLIPMLDSNPKVTSVFH